MSSDGLRSASFSKGESGGGSIDSNQNLAFLGEAKRAFQAYFERGESSGLLRLELSPSGSEFQKKVWSELSKVPLGKTLSYSQLASRIGQPSATRAVANACGKNPILIACPCHRVLRKGGELGGFRAGISTKKALLKHEGVQIG